MLAGISQYAGVSAYPPRTTLAASLSRIDSRSPATTPASAAAASRDSIAWIALSLAAACGLVELGTLARTLRYVFDSFYF